MCNPTSSPPRREMYELQTELAADKGGFFVPKKPKPPRIGEDRWECDRPNIFGIYNADYMADGTRYEQLDKPWTAIGPVDTYGRFTTHAEALAWVLQEARK